VFSAQKVYDLRKRKAPHIDQENSILFTDFFLGNTPVITEYEAADSSSGTFPVKIKQFFKSLLHILRRCVIKNLHLYRVAPPPA